MSGARQSGGATQRPFKSGNGANRAGGKLLQWADDRFLRTTEWRRVCLTSSSYEQRSTHPGGAAFGRRAMRN